MEDLLNEQRVSTSIGTPALPATLLAFLASHRPFAHYIAQPLHSELPFSSAGSRLGAVDPRAVPYLGWSDARAREVDSHRLAHRGRMEERLIGEAVHAVPKGRATGAATWWSGREP